VAAVLEPMVVAQLQQVQPIVVVEVAAQVKINCRGQAVLVLLLFVIRWHIILLLIPA
jgi:hypothetical protein